MKTLQSKFVLLTLLIGLFVSCSKDDDFNPSISDQAEVISFKINTVEGVINGNIITVTLPNGTDIANLQAQVTLSANATISPNPETSINYSSPKQFTITAQDGLTTKNYTVTVTTSATPPTAENPYSEGVFVLRWLQANTYELDFRHTSGTVTTKVFQKANTGKTIDGFSITDIIPHKKGYVVFSNVDDGSGGRIYFTDLKLVIKKELNIEKANVVSNRYAQIGTKVYYTNISDPIEVNQQDNKTYVIDTDTESLTKVSSQYLQFFADNNNNLYGLNIASGLNKITNFNALSGTLLTNFNQHSNSFVLDANNRLWSTRDSKFPSNFVEVTKQRNGLFDYRLDLTCYDLNSNTKIEGVSTEDINRDSWLFISNNKVYLTTNQNSHLSDAKKELQEMYLDGNAVKLRVVHELPKVATPQYVVEDNFGFNFIGGTMMIFGNNNDVPANNGSRTYYYDLNINSGTTSNKTLGIANLFERKATR